MRLTDYTDYALRVLMHLGVHPGELITTRQIATAHGISHNHLTKIVHQLGQSGVLATSRGRTGGIRLAMAPDQIMLGTVIRLTEPDFTMVECFAPSANTCILSAHCRLRCLLADATEAYLGRLDKVPLSALLVAPGRARARSGSGCIPIDAATP
jgi:Rrf2 family nitric oxide-sensitive transcriptional repressor